MSKKGKQPKKARKKPVHRYKEPLATRTKKKAAVKAFISTFGNISQSCDKIGIDNSTFHRWVNDDPNFVEDLEVATERKKDFGEHCLMKKMAEGCTTSTIFFNKTQNKDRGYVERQEVAGVKDQPVNIDFVKTYKK